jgi:hypothetical protein
MVDPAVPDSAAWLLRRNRRLLLAVRGGWAPRRRRRYGPIVELVGSSAAGMAALTAIGAGIGFFGEERFTPFAVVMAVIALLLTGMVLKPGPEERLDWRRAAERNLYDKAREYEGRFVLLDDLDVRARAMLSRAHDAVDSVLNSHVHAEGLLDRTRNAATLPAHEWEIARLLAKLSRLRTDHAKLELGMPEVAAVAEPLGQALAGSERAVLARVEVLERYAEQVAQVERAYRVRRQLEQFTSRLPRYEELLAESGAGVRAVPEIDHLTQDADRLEEALLDSVTSAHEAFQHLSG